ncbi:MAG: surface lipoprotein assembly modifier, partial [Pseudomonadota bacterium]
GTDNDTVEIAGLPFSIDEQARRKSGIGFELGGNVAVRQTMTPTVTFLANMKAVGRFYPSVESVQLNFDSTAGLAKRFGRNKSASLALTGSTSHSGERFTRQSIGVQGEFQNRFNARWSGYVSGFARLEDDLTDAGRDGWRAGVYTHLDRYFGRKHFARVLASADFARFEVDRFSYDEGKIGLGYNRELPLGLDVYMQGDVALRDYYGLYPGLDENQRDIRVGAQATFTKRDFTIGGLAPRVTYRFERNFSNAAFDDRTRHEFDVRLTKDF